MLGRLYYQVHLLAKWVIFNEQKLAINQLNKTVYIFEHVRNIYIF
jgi:hypothetical protein